MYVTSFVEDVIVSEQIIKNSRALNFSLTWEGQEVVNWRGDGSLFRGYLFQEMDNLPISEIVRFWNTKSLP